MNHLGILLKCKLSFGRPGVGPRFCISHEFPGERDTADPQAELSGTLSKEGLDPDHSLQPHLSPGLYLALLSLKSSLVSSKHTRFQPVSRPATHCTLYLDCSFLPPTLHTHKTSPQPLLRHPHLRQATSTPARSTWHFSSFLHITVEAESNAFRAHGTKWMSKTSRGSISCTSVICPGHVARKPAERHQPVLPESAITTLIDLLTIFLLQ